MSNSEEPRIDYDSAVQHLDAFGSALKSLITQLLGDAGVAVHSVEFRVKGPESASRKLSRGADKYSGYDDLTDMLGVRVITYFPDEVDEVARVLTPEFAVDEENSVDKRRALDPDRFGYLSLHYVATLKTNRSGLPEYRRFGSSTFEVQIRSILQHAWAEIEHDLGYKAEGALPRDMRRRFSRLAGLLELADDEFSRLRDDRDVYEAQVRDDLHASPEELEVDQSTVSALLQTDALIDLDQEIAALFPAPTSENIDTKYAANLARDARSLGVANVQTLTRIVDARSSHAVAFARIWLQRRERTEREKPLSRGIGLFYVLYTLVADSEEPVVDRWRERRLSKSADSLVTRLRETWQVVKNELGEPPDDDSQRA